jgi:two-component sensor histidine kinase
MRNIARCSTEMADNLDSDALDRVRRHIRIIVDIGRIASVATDQSEFLDQVVMQVARAIEINHVKILQYRPQQADFIVAAGLGWREGVVRTATMAADLRTPPGRAYRTAEPVTIVDFDQQSEYDLSPFLKAHGIVSLANVPIMIDGAAWGVLEVDSTVPRDFSEDTTEFLRAAGALIGAFLRHRAVQPTEAAQIAQAIGQAQDREVLLREMQHRIKNNFQLILGSIAVQKRRYSSGEAHRALDHIASRINAISLAHDQLAPRKSGQIVKLSDYIRALCGSIRQQVERIEVNVKADEIELAIDRAVPLGLILNELATNSIKHAFGTQGGAIHITLAGGVGYGEAQLTVADNGRGMADRGQSGSGVKLVAMLAHQIGGSVEQNSSDRGTITSVRFPIIV